MVMPRLWRLGILLAAHIGAAASLPECTWRGASCDSNTVDSDSEEASALQQRLARGAGSTNLTASLGHGGQSLQPEGPLIALPCLALWLSTGAFGALLAVLGSALWSRVSFSWGLEYRDTPDESADDVMTAMPINLCMACLWMALFTVIAVYTSYISNLRVTALAISALCCGALALDFFGTFPTKEKTSPATEELPTPAWRTLLLLAAIISLLLAGGRGQFIGLTWLLSLIGMGPAVFSAYEICFGDRVATASWAAVCAQAVLLATLTYAYAESSEFRCAWVDENWDPAGNPELSVAAAAFVLFMFGFYSMARGLARRRVAFLGLMAFIASPAASALTGKTVLLGPWGMFAGSHEGHQLSAAGYAMVFCAGVLLAILSLRSDETLGLAWASRGKRPSLALVRMLIPFWLLLSRNWGYSMPYLQWHLPIVGPVAGSIGPAVLIASAASLAFGFYSQIGALLAVTGFFLGLARLEFDTDSPVRCITMLLMILAYTPCDSCFSARPHRDESLWAKSLFRLHMSLLYFFAGMFKVQPDWLKPDGGSLYKDIHLLQNSPLRALFHLLLPSEHATRTATTVLAYGTIVAELFLAFALWRKSWHLVAICSAALMHLAMSLLCGELGGFTQAAWIGLLASVEDERFEKFLAEPRQFALTVVGLMGAFVVVGAAF